MTLSNDYIFAWIVFVRSINQVTQHVRLQLFFKLCQDFIVFCFLETNISVTLTNASVGGKVVFIL